MVSVIRILSALAVLGAGAALAADDRATKLDKGEVLVSAQKVEGSQAPRVKVEAVIDASPEDVWAVVKDCENYKKTMPRISESKLEKREGNVVICRTRADMPFPLADLEAVTRGVESVEPGKRWAREWDLVEGDYNANTGGWELTHWKGEESRTLVVYKLHADPKLAVPQGLINAAQKSALPDLMHQLRKSVKNAAR